MITDPINKFIRLSRDDRRLLLRSLWLVGTVRLWLTFLPFGTVRRLTSRRLSSWGIVPGTNSATRDGIDRVAWAIRSASRLVPAATCLTQALAGRILYARFGEHSVLRIGVAKGGDRFEAHAWVEKEGRIVIGATGRRDFVALPQPHDELI